MLNEKRAEATRVYARMKARYPDVRWGPREFFLDLVEEVGELANAVMCELGDKFAHRRKADLGDSFFDVLFDLFLLADALGVDLDAEWEKGIELFEKRLDEGEFDPR